MLLSLWGSGQVGLAELSTYPQARDGPRRSGSRGLLLGGFHGAAIGAVARQTAGSVEDGQVGVGIFMHPEARLDEICNNLLRLWVEA